MAPFSETQKPNHLNSVWVEGYLTSFPLDTTGSSEPRSYRFRFRVETRQPPEPPDYFLVDASEAAFRGCRNRLLRGKPVRVLGRLGQHRWKDPSGTVQTDLKILGDLVEPLGVSP